MNSEVFSWSMETKRITIIKLIIIKLRENWCKIYKRKSLIYIQSVECKYLVMTELEYCIIDTKLHIIATHLWIHMEAFKFHWFFSSISGKKKNYQYHVNWYLTRIFRIKKLIPSLSIIVTLHYIPKTINKGIYRK